MANSYTAGQATLELVPSFKGFHRTVETQIRSYNPAIQVTADTRAAVREITGVTRERRTAVINVEVAKNNLSKAQAEITAAERALTSSRDASSDAAKRVEIAEAKLTETRSRSGVKASQVGEAELRLSQAHRASAAAINDVRAASDRLLRARGNRSKREGELFDASTLAQGAQNAVRDVSKLGDSVASVSSIIGGMGLQGAASFGKIAGEASSAAGPVGALVATTIGVAAIGGAGAFAAAGLIGLANAALQAAGAVALVPAGLAAGGAVAATAYIGFMGVTDAIEAMGKADQQASYDAQTSAKRQRGATDAVVSARIALSRAVDDSARNIEQADRRIEDAERQVARARVDAARSVLQADRAAAAADDAYQRSQRALQDTIDETTRAQRDLNFQVRAGALDAEEATLDLATAQEQFAAAQEAGVQGDELRRYEIAAKRAQLQVDETAASNGDLADKQREAQRTGVMGARAVVDATRQAADAQQALADAVQEASDARVRADEQVADAQRQVADAEDARAQVVIQNQRSIADAERALESAVASTAEATDQVSSSAKAAQIALAQLSPEAREFVKAVHDLTPAWTDVKNAIQDALFNGLDDKLKQLTDVYFPIMKHRLSDIADAANDAAGELVDLLTGPEASASVDKILADTKDIIKELAKAVGPLITAFLDIAEVGTDVLKGVASDSVDAAEAFRDWIREMKDSGKLREWMDGAVDILKKIVVFSLSAGKALVSIITALNQGVSDSGFYDQIGQLFTDFMDFVQSDEGKQFMYNLGRTIGDIAGWVLKAIEFVAKLMEWWNKLDTIVRDASDGATGFFEVIGRGFLAVSTLGISELIINAFSIDWDGLGAWFESSTGQVFGRVALAITTFGLSEIIRGAFSIDWDALGTWFHDHAFGIMLRIGAGVATFGLSEILTAAFDIDWEDVGRRALDGLNGLFEKIGNAILDNPVGQFLFSGLKGTIGVAAGAMPWNANFNPMGRADGGIVTGPGTSRSDSIPTWLSNGEFVVNARATAANRGHLEWLNARGYADGGFVGTGAAPGGGAAAAGVVIDPAAIAGLGDVAAAVTVEMVALHDEITALVTDLVVYWARILDASAVAADGITARQSLLQAFYATSWAGIQTAVWASTNSQTAAFVALINGMASVRDAMTQTANWATDQYGRIRAAAADPIRWVLANPFNLGLIAAWNQLDSDFALNKHVNPVPIGFAVGGRVRGPGTGTSDSIDARLSNGEFVVRAAIVRQVLPFLDALNSGQGEALEAAGLHPRRFATGGLVADTGSQLNAAVFRGQKFLREQAGKPYVWGGVGPDGYDCSGLVSAVTNVLRGESNPYRRLGTAASQPWAGFVSGLTSSFATGFNDHHTALTLAGLNGEAQTFGVPVLVGPRASGADSGQFTGTASLPFVGGKFIPGGGPGADPASILAAAFADVLAQVDTIDQMWPGNRAAAAGGGLVRSGVSALTTTGTSLLEQMLVGAGAVAGSPEVKAAVRAVAAGFGWGDGAEWAALDSLISGESSWNPWIKNPDSSAAGLFQKMTSLHGPLEPDIAGQARWGLNYIRGAYGDPINAYMKWLSRSPHWYDDGGIANGIGFMAKNTLEPERVLSPAMTRSFDQLLAVVGSGQLSPAAADSGLANLRGIRISGPVTVNGLDGYIDGRIEDYDHATGDALRFGARP